jgi:hypothetical protein
MPRFTMRPRQIDAMRFTGSNAGVVAAWAASLGGVVVRGVSLRRGTASDVILVATPAGKMACPPGWWVVREPDGSFQPVSPEAFDAGYEPVDS